MDNEKYYTPDITEFHVDFECEINLDKSWKNTILNKGDLNGLFFYKTLHKDNIRVKYLDKEDIESLGWKITKIHNESELEAQFQIGPHCFFDLSLDSDTHELNIEYFYQPTLIQTSMPKTSFNSYTVFRGTIKNRSELSRLMKQLNIL